MRQGINIVRKPQERHGLSPMHALKTYAFFVRLCIGKCALGQMTATLVGIFVTGDGPVNKFWFRLCCGFIFWWPISVRKHVNKVSCSIKMTFRSLLA